MKSFFDGLVGCPSWRRFRIDPAPGDLPVFVLESLDEEGLQFLAIDPSTLIADYAAAIPADDLSVLGLADIREAQLLVLLTLQQAQHITANLLGPLVIDRASGAARQVVLVDSGYTTRHALEGSGNMQELDGGGEHADPDP